MANYQYQASLQKRYTHNEIVKSFEEKGSEFDVNGKSDFVEASLCQEFGIPAVNLKAARFQPSNRFDSAAIATDFFLGLTIPEAEKLVDKINRRFPNAAQLIATNTHIDDKENVDLQQIAIRNDVLMSENFKQTFQHGLYDLANTYPRLIEKYLQESKTRARTTEEIVFDLNILAKTYATNHQGLFLALHRFAESINQHKAKNFIIEGSSFELKKAIANYESTFQANSQLRLFKNGDKRKIKDIQKEVYVHQNRYSY